MVIGPRAFSGAAAIQSEVAGRRSIALPARNQNIPHFGEEHPPMITAQIRPVYSGNW